MKNKMGIASASMALAFGFMMAGCATEHEDHHHSNDGSSAVGLKKDRMTAQAALSPKSGSNVRGTVTFLEEVEGVRVTANIEGLTPGPHGFHIHEKGDCSSDDGSSAGGHFNPTGAPHGAPTSGQHHLGDFGNIEANKDGVARFERVFYFLRMEGTNSILGHSIIVHEKPDDMASQPSGNAGARQACGVIEKVSK
jgi:Cu-Zn family superoxide dismutase